MDPNQNLHNTMDEINSILGTLGSASSQTVYGTTGVGIDDCALDFQVGSPYGKLVLQVSIV